jgi:hypothetical protein
MQAVLNMAQGVCVRLHFCCAIISTRATHTHTHKLTNTQKRACKQEHANKNMHTHTHTHAQIWLEGICTHRWLRMLGIQPASRPTSTCCARCVFATGTPQSKKEWNRENMHLGMECAGGCVNAEARTQCVLIHFSFIKSVFARLTYKPLWQKCAHSLLLHAFNPHQNPCWYTRWDEL